MTEYQPRTSGRLVELLLAQDENPRSWQHEAAARITELEAERDALLNKCASLKLRNDNLAEMRDAHAARALAAESDLARVRGELDASNSNHRGGGVVMCVCCGKPAIGKCEGPSDPSPTAPAPDVREASERVLQSLNALASGLLSPDQNETSTAMASEASQAIDDAIIVNDFLAALSQQPVAVADREAIAGEFEPVGTQYLHYSPFTGHEVWLDRDFYNGHRATVSREVFARKSALALLQPQPEKAHIINPLNHEQTK